MNNFNIVADHNENVGMRYPNINVNSDSLGLEMLLNNKDQFEEGYDTKTNPFNSSEDDEDLNDDEEEEEDNDDDNDIVSKSYFNNGNRNPSATSFQSLFQKERSQA